MIGVHRKMVEMEQECSKRRVEVVQLRKELQNTQDESKNLKEKVHALFSIHTHTIKLMYIIIALTYS